MVTALGTDPAKTDLMDEAAKLSLLTRSAPEPAVLRTSFDRCEAPMDPLLDPISPARRPQVLSLEAAALEYDRPVAIYARPTPPPGVRPVDHPHLVLFHWPFVPPHEGGGPEHPSWEAHEAVEAAVLSLRLTGRAHLMLMTTGNGLTRWLFYVRDRRALDRDLAVAFAGLAVPGLLVLDGEQPDWSDYQDYVTAMQGTPVPTSPWPTRLWPTETLSRVDASRTWPIRLRSKLAPRDLFRALCYPDGYSTIALMLVSGWVAVELSGWLSILTVAWAMALPSVLLYRLDRWFHESHFVRELADLGAIPSEVRPPKESSRRFAVWVFVSLCYLAASAVVPFPAGRPHSTIVFIIFAVSFWLWSSPVADDSAGPVVAPPAPTAEWCPDLPESPTVEIELRELLEGSGQLQPEEEHDRREDSDDPEPEDRDHEPQIHDWIGLHPRSWPRMSGNPIAGAWVKSARRAHRGRRRSFSP